MTSLQYSSDESNGVLREWVLQWLSWFLECFHLSTGLNTQLVWIKHCKERERERQRKRQRERERERGREEGGRELSVMVVSDQYAHLFLKSLRSCDSWPFHFLWHHTCPLETCSLHQRSWAPSADQGNDGTGSLYVTLYMYEINKHIIWYYLDGEALSKN